MSISTKIVLLRKDAGLTQQQLADELGIACSSLRVYEKGQGTLPPADVIVRICRRFSVSSDFLLGLSASEDVQLSADVPEELRQDADAVMKAAATLCEIEGSRAFHRSVLPLYRQIIQSLADLTAGADEDFSQLIALDPVYAGTDRPGVLPEELRQTLLQQVAEGAVDPQLQSTVKAGRDYEKNVQQRIDHTSLVITTLLRMAIAPELGGKSTFRVQ